LWWCYYDDDYYYVVGPAADCNEDIYDVCGHDANDGASYLGNRNVMNMTNMKRKELGGRKGRRRF
jgi:hypothetical protein